MTTAEREAFDALVKYAEMEEDARTLSSKDLDAKYNNIHPSDFTYRMSASRRLALEKAREVQSPICKCGEVNDTRVCESCGMVKCPKCQSFDMNTCRDCLDMWASPKLRKRK